MNEDQEAHSTIGKGYPSLFIYDEGSRVEPESDLVHYCRRGGDADELEKAQVRRWVDVPLMTPKANEVGPPTVHPWGKLSVDDAEDSDRLSPRDVADVTMLAAVAGGAIADRLRAQRDKQLLDTYEEYTAILETADWRRPDERIMRRVKILLLELYRDLFGLELAIYRDFHPEDRTLRYEGVCSMEPGALPDDCEIPPVVHVHDYPSYERFDRHHVDDEGNVLPGAAVEPYCHDRADAEIRRMLERRKELSDAELRYLCWVQSEIGIPILVRNKVRGIILGLSGRTDAFPVDRDLVLGRFRNAAQLWFQLGELHDARVTAIKTFRDCLKAWSLLQDVPDDRLYAGLAAILTAGCGLSWHRALIFRNIPDGSQTAELAYAVGGLGEPEHGYVQKHAEELHQDLESLVLSRIEDPVPHGIDPRSGIDRTDSLYDKYLTGDGPPIRISYASPDSPLRRILGPDLKGRVPFLKVPREDPMLHALPASQRDLFPARTTYFFPLYPNRPDQAEEILGLIALDNAYRPNPWEDTFLALTLAIVELVRDVVEARLSYRLISGMLGALPIIRHGPKIMSAWRGFKRVIDELLLALDEGRDHPSRELLTDLRGALSKLEDPVKKMAVAQQQVESWRGPGREPAQIPDLEEYLVRLIAAWSAKANFVETSISLKGRLALPCDPVILDNTLRLILENAGSVSPRGEDGRFPISIKVHERDDVYPFAKLATIEVRDFGPGIPPANVPFLFIDGYSDRRGLAEFRADDEPTPRHKGLGLGMARAFLLRASGELLLKDDGWPGRGATFAILFGLGKQSPINPRTSEEAQG